ncbi:MAG: hypothetical protein HFH15_00075 [Ruminococcus sp.]|jgi:hypothetical protein|nr:hypothetical protein [Ruminococcus sp.]
MIAMKLKSTKNFMTHLLLSDTFDHFLFIEGEIVTFNTFTIDGYIQKAFYESNETDSPCTEAAYGYALWKQLRELCFSMIKGKRTPLSFKFIFSLSPDNIARLIEQKNLDFQSSDVQGLYLNIRFDGSVLQCVTGTSLKTFSMDKSLEREWDAMVPRFFDKKGLEFEMED